MREILFRFLLVLISILAASCSRTSETSDEVDKRVFKLPIEQVKELAANGDSSAKFRLLLENNYTLSEAEKLKILSEIYEKDKHLAAGYQLATLTPDRTKREKILKEISESGSSPTALLAKTTILASKLNSDFGKDAKQAYDELLNLAKGGVQPAAAELAFFIKTNFSQFKNPSDFYEGALIAYKTLAEKSSFDVKYYKLCQAEFLIRLGKWNDAAELLKPLAKDFMAQGNFTMWYSLFSALEGYFYAEAKACALLACAYEEGLGVPKDAKKASELRAKVYALQNEKFCKNFSYSFEESYGERAYFLCDSPREAKIYKDWARELEASRTERLRNYNLKVSREIEEVSKKPLEELKNASDEIGKVEYAKKLLDLETFDNIALRIGKYNKKKAAEALSILKELAKHGSQYANLTLAELYQGGNSWNPSFAILNMPVDFDAQKASHYARSALLLGGGEYKTYFNARARKLLGDLSLYRSNSISFMSMDGYSVKSSRKDFEDALLHYRVAAFYGSGEALDRLAKIYANGIPIGMGKYLAEPNELASFTYLKDSADLGNPDNLAVLIRRLYSNKKPQEDAGELAKYIKRFLDSSAKPSIAHEIAAIYVEKGLIEGYEPKDAKKIRDSIPRSSAWYIEAQYSRGLFASKAGREYWSNVKAKITTGENNKFANYFKSLEQTQENRLLFAISSVIDFGVFGKSYDKSFMADGNFQWKKLIAEGYPPAVRAANFYIAKKYASSSYLKGFDYVSAAKKLKLPIAIDSTGDSEADIDYNIKRYEETKDDAFLYMLSNSNESNPKLYEFMYRFGKNNDMSLECAIYLLLKADAGKNPKGFDELISFIENCSKSKYNAGDINALLAYAHSGFPKMRNDPALFAKYSAKAGKNSIRLYVNTLRHKGMMENSDLNRLSAFAYSLEKSNSTSDAAPENFGKDSIEGLRAVYEKNPENRNLAYLLAEAEFKNKNYAEAEKLYAKLHEAEAKNLRYAVRLGEIYYYGLGVKADKELALKYYNMLFDELKRDCTVKDDRLVSIHRVVFDPMIKVDIKNPLSPIGDALPIFFNSISLNSSGYPKVKIPKKLILKNIVDIPIKNLSVQSYDLLEWLSKNKQDKLREKLEKKFLEAKDKNVMKIVAVRNLSLNTPEADAKAFELFNELWKGGDKSVLNIMGALYFAGRGVKQDYGKAREIFESGIGLPPEISQPACVWLALMYKEGFGVEKSEESSAKYLQLVYKVENSIYYSVSDIAKRLIYGGKMYGYPESLDIIPKSPELGVELLKYNFEKGGLFDRSYDKLEYARIIEEGKYTKRDLPKAAEFYEYYARSQAYHDYACGEYVTFSDAMRALKSSGSERDLKKAFALASEWLKDKPDSINAKLEMGLLKMFGIACEKDPKAAFKYINEATNSSLGKDANLWRAYGLLAYCYLEGIGVQKSEDKAREIAEEVGKIKGRIHYLPGVGFGDTMLDLASWFVASKEPWKVDGNPLLPQSKNCALFWLNEYERKADKAEDADSSKEVYQKLIGFYENHKELAGKDKISKLREKIGKLNNKAK